jgi:ANTAR domain
VVASGTVGQLAITAGSSPGTSLIVSVTTFAGQYVGALDLFWAHPGVLGAEQLASALVAAELAQMPLLDLPAEDLQAAVADPDSDSWAELNTLSRAEVSQATGMLVAQLEVEPAEALVRLRAHALATGRSATDVACDILDRRLRLQADLCALISCSTAAPLPTGR